jgi:hypothetical protein
MKSLLIADCLFHEALKPCGHVVAVDSNLDRLFVARSIARKHISLCTEVLPVSFTLADGRCFDPEILLRSVDGMHPDSASLDGRIRQLNTFLQRERKRTTLNRDHPMVLPPDTVEPVLVGGTLTSAMSSHRCLGTSRILFDRVLVDAECTHDGSIAHLAMELPDQHAPHSGLTNDYRMQRMNIGGVDSALMDLQLDLLTNGFRHLKVGGHLVYSTCSFSALQNENIVEKFLNRVNGERVCAVCVAPFEVRMNPRCGKGGSLIDMTEEQLQAMRTIASIGGESENYCTRFWPHVSLTSFQFIAKIKRVNE